MILRLSSEHVVLPMTFTHQIERERKGGGRKRREGDEDVLSQAETA